MAPMRMAKKCILNCILCQFHSKTIREIILDEICMTKRNIAQLQIFSYRLTSYGNF